MNEQELRNSLYVEGVPEHDHDSIIRYLIHGIPPGSFLTAVIQNDLRESLGRADKKNRAALFNIVSWFYNHAPLDCWGSPERMTEWMAGRRSAVKEKS